MKIAVTSNGKNLDAEVDPRFGRAANFIIVEPENMDYTVIENQQTMNLPQGAGIQAGKTIVDNRVDVVLTGNCGPKAFKVLEAAGVKVVINAEGTVKEVIEQFQNGVLGGYAETPNVNGHWG
ncbi:MAG TPA: NifB/NifX family molybdenum-iron cluster-binding protein [Desulfosalsimonadaceae bacterium]|nr:NifB/NifX family molybdenum-iron cluster-binding protein [Desulfosalsimonadaceae bacterium]